MKKVLALVLAAVICALGFGACSGGKTYSDLSVIEGVKLGSEVYGIAFRTGSDMVQKVDEITAELFADGSMKALADKYGLTDGLVEDFIPSDDHGEPMAESDYEYIKSKGVMVVGITNFEPINYKDENGEWTGFDTEYARMVGEKLGVEVEFKQIVWGNKEMELQSKSIDCIWNGMTVTDAIKNAADVTGAYLTNYQGVVVKDAQTYDSLESLAGKTIVAESGSAGENAVKADEYLSQNYKPVEAQSNALLEVQSGSADACVIDYIMANSMLGE